MTASAQIWQFLLLAFWLGAPGCFGVDGFEEFVNWEEPRDEVSWVEQEVQQGRWDAQQVAGSQMVGWQVQPKYQDLSPQHNQGGLYGKEKDQQYYHQFNNEDQQYYDQFKKGDEQHYDQFKVEDQHYYDHFRAHIDQIQRRGGSRRDPSSYPRLPRRGVERDVQQSLFGSERQFGELTDPFFQPAESDSIFDFGRETVQLGLPLAWEEARKRRQSAEVGRRQPSDGYFQYINVPAPEEYEFGFNRGNPNHFISRYEQSKDHRFRTRVRWGDSYGGYGEHYYEYNHGPAGYEDAPKYPAPEYSKYPLQTNYV